MGSEVYVSDFNFEGLDERAIRVTTPIFGDEENLFEKLGKPDVCIHMAWRNGFVHNADSHIVDLPQHYEFIKNMLDGGLKQIIVMGSMHEVGYWEGAIEETTPCNPKSLYGIAKNALRQAVFSMPVEEDVCLQWVRAYYILGDDLKNNSIFSRIIKMEQEGAETFPFTSGKNKFDFISVDMLAEQIAKTALQREIDGVINCCTGNPVSLADKVEEFIAENHFKIRPEYGAFPDRPYDSPGVWGDPTKINEIIKQYK